MGDLKSVVSYPEMVNIDRVRTCLQACADLSDAQVREMRQMYDAMIAPVKAENLHLLEDVDTEMAELVHLRQAVIEIVRKWYGHPHPDDNYYRCRLLRAFSALMAFESKTGGGNG